MSKLLKSNSPAATTQSEAFEMIELAIDDLDALTRAFSMVTRVCDELNQSCFEQQPVDLEVEAEDEVEAEILLN